MNQYATGTVIFDREQYDGINYKINDKINDKKKADSMKILQMKLLQIYRHLKNLSDQMRIERVGSRKNGYWKILK